MTEDADELAVVKQPPSILNEDLAVVRNIRKLLSVGYKTSPDGTLRPKELLGRGGRQKFWRSGLVRRIKAKYPADAATRLRALYAADTTWWDRFELSLQAVGGTILVNTEVDLALLPKDLPLLEAWDNFKVWWVNYALKGASVGPDRQPRFPFLIRAVRGLKIVSAWLRFYAARHPDNDAPGMDGSFMGFLPGSRRHVFPWFGGHLRFLRDPSKEDITPLRARTLCQASTFGRALPPAWGDYLTESGEETLRVLTTRFETPREVLEQYYNVARDIGAYLPKVGLTSHTSLTKSGAYETPGEDGGCAAELIPGLQPFADSICAGIQMLNTDPAVLVGGYRSRPLREDPWSLVRGVEREVALKRRPRYDCFGRLLLQFDDRGKTSLNLDPSTFVTPAPLFEATWIPESLLKGQNLVFLWPLEFRSIWLDGDGPDWAKPNAGLIWTDRVIGKLLEQLCIARLMRDELIEPDIDPDGWVGEPFEGIPYWESRHSIEFEQTAPFPCRFVVLGEPGLKPRPLTIGRADVQVLGKALRFLVEPCLHAEKRLRIGFEETDILWTYSKYIRKNRDRLTGDTLMLNLDYKSATDYIPSDLIDRIWDGFMDGQRLPEVHPMRSLRFLINPSYLLTSGAKNMAHLFVSGPRLQRRGSFMGTPMSFLTLSLYNLCTINLAECMARLKVCRHLRVDEIPADSAVPRRMCSIVGDDVQCIGTKRLMDAIAFAVRSTGMVLSPGKNLVSRQLLILCEDVAFWDGAEYHFLDVVKLRLLTRMTRLHSDHRAAILGRGAPLRRVLSWNDSQSVREGAVIMYRDTFADTMGGAFFLPKPYPIELHPAQGGFSYPGREWPIFEEDCRFSLRFLRWMLNLPLGDFLRWSTVLGSLNTRLTKGVLLDPDTREVSELFQRYEPGTLDAEVGPRRFTTYGRGQVLNFLRARGHEIPTNMAGDPINKVVAQLAREEGLATIHSIMDMVERLETFRAMLRDPSKGPDRYSFPLYQRNCYAFWHNIRLREGRGDFAGNPIPEEHGFKSFEDISRAFWFRRTLYVQLEGPDMWFIKFGPGFQLNYWPPPSVDRS